MADQLLPLPQQEWIYVKRPEGEEPISVNNYEYREEPFSTPSHLQDGDVFVEALFLSVDPYMRIQQSALNTWESPHPLGVVQGGASVVRVIRSQNGEWREGDVALAYTGWRRYATLTQQEASKMRNLSLLVDNKIPLSVALGALGMPARTAYCGFFLESSPKKGETVLVSGAAGAVGSLVVQLAQTFCKVIAITSSADKMKWLTDIGATDVISYVTHNTPDLMRDAIHRAAPEGIDIYWDNVGGWITDSVIPEMRVKGRIIICGQISQYNNGSLDTPPLAPRFLHHVLYKRLTIKGILARDYMDRMDEVVEAMLTWIKEGKLTYKETVVDGFKELPTALQMIFHSENIGKIVVNVDGKM